jgi:Family of unknown function (DUF6582)
MNVLTDMSEWTFPITKAEAQPDGSLIVEGVATSEALDNTEPVPEIVDYENAKACMADWPGNVREMHQLKAVGRSLGWFPDDENKRIVLRTRVSAGEPGTIQKVLDGTLNSYSVAGPPLKRVMEAAKKADGSRISANRLFYKRFSEISLVDRGMNPEARFSIVKADAVEDDVELPEPVQVWACQEPSHRHVFKSEAASCIAEQAAAKALVMQSLAEGNARIVEQMAQEGVEKAEKKPEGDYGSSSDAGYADPGLQPDKKPRYPLKKDGKLNSSRIHAAWNYINKRKNAAQYSADAVKKIKARIIAAWKQAIDKDGPPSAAKGEPMYDLKAVRDAFVAKAAAFGVTLTSPADDALKVGFAPDQYGWAGTKEVQDALSGLYALSLVEELIRSEEFEDEDDPEDEQQVQVLTSQVVAGLVEFIGSELAELIEDEAAGDGEEAMKALGVRAKMHITKENAQAVHNHVVKAYGAKCNKAAKADGSEGGSEEGDGDKAMRAGTQPLHPTTVRLTPRVRGHLNKSNAQDAHDHAVSLGAKCMKAEKADDVAVAAKSEETGTTEAVAEVAAAAVVKTNAPVGGDAAKVQADLDAVKAEIASIRTEIGALAAERDGLKADLVAARAKQVVEPGTPLALDADGKPVPAPFIGTEKSDSLPISESELEDIVAKAHGDAPAMMRAVHMRLAEKGIRSTVAAAIRGGR